MLVTLGWIMISIAIFAILVLAAVGGLFLWAFFIKSDGVKIIKDAWNETNV